MTRVLLIEDNRGDAVIVTEMLEQQKPQEYEVIPVVRVSEAAKILQDRHDIDVIISDIALPDTSGEEAFERLKTISHNVPVIFFTGTHDESLAMTALQEGAQDYLLKGQFQGAELRRAIRYAIERNKVQLQVQKAINRAKRSEQKAERLKLEREHLIQINQAKEEFLSLASHQLRTPATGVKQYLRMLLEGFAGDVPDQQRQLIEQADVSNERQLKIVNDLLQTARIDSGRITLDCEPVDIVQMLTQVTDEQFAQFMARNQKICLSPGLDTLMISADYDSLRMAFDNLIDNAGKYSHRDTTVTVTIALKDAQAVITIEDEGVGIAAQDLPHVFQKFSRINNPLADDVGGSGLGLFWAKSIITMHSGTITVNSELGKGTTFTVLLPLSNEEHHD